MADSMEPSSPIDLELPTEELFEDDDTMDLIEHGYQLWWHWADFELSIVTPTIPEQDPAILIPPEALPNSSELEFVYPILDRGNSLSTSKGTEMYTVGMSMCKLYYTIEKMIAILIERLKSGGIDTETEVQIAFGGFELAQRKAFESVINLSYNVIVNNFEPGEWGEAFLKNIEQLAKMNFGYPTSAPRDNYRQVHQSSSQAPR